MAFHSPLSTEDAVFTDDLDPASQLDVAAGRANHDLKFTGFDYPLMVHVSEI